MLKELNGIANDMLGLHGYPVQRISWGEIFGKRARANAAREFAKPPSKPARPPAAGTCGVGPARFGSRSHA